MSDKVKDYKIPTIEAEVLSDIRSPAIVEKAPLVKPVNVDEEADKKLLQDFEEARKAIKNNITHANDVITELTSVAIQSQHPRAYEVLGQFLKTTSDMAKDLMSLHKAKKDIEKADINSPNDSTKTITQTNNTILVGTTDDLNRLIKGQK